MFEGSKNAKVLFVSDFLRSKEIENNEILSGERRDILVNAMSAAGVLPSEYAFTVIHPNGAKGNKVSGFSQSERTLAQLNCKAIINESKANVIVPLGDYALKFITGLDNCSKQHLSLLPVKAEFGARKAVPLLHPETIQRSYGDVAYIRFGAMRIKGEMSSPLLTVPERKFLLSLDMVFDAQVSYLENVIKSAQEVSTDVETGNGQVNTVGLAISPTEAIVIDSRPEGKTPAQFHKLWDLYRQIWSSQSIGKIAQNGLFEAQWASLYGIEFNALTFDTMWAMKLLHPTLERGLGNVGRLYTRYPYWKDDHSDWNNVRDWRNHLNYCGKDCTGQFAAKVEMQRALEARGLSEFFHKTIMPQYPIALEMMNRGLRIDWEMLGIMKTNAQRSIDSFMDSMDRSCEIRLGRKVNVNSPKQIKDALKELGIRIPTVKGKETTSKAAMMKLKSKHPKEHIISDIIEIDRLQKQLDDYLNFEADDDSRVRFSMDLASDENGLWVGKKSMFDRGFDPTSVPQIVKNCIIPDEGRIFVQVKLNQAELKFIAKDAPDYRLMEMLNKYEDVNRFMAEKIFSKPLPSKTQIKVAAQVIKSANEFDSPRQFVEKCFARSGLFYTDIEARRFMQIFFEEFSGCRNRIERIKKTLYSKRMLDGENRKITYYDRINDSLLRKALAWGPESHASDEMTKFMLSLPEHVEFVSRGKDWVLVQVPDGMYLGKAEINGSIQIGDRWGSLKNV